MKQKGFHKRGFTSFLVFLSFLAMTVTGLVLYFAPQGRVAYWVDWRFLWLTRTQWVNIHVITSLLFAGTGIYHLVLNWKVFLAYLRDRARSALALMFEMGLALVLTVFFVAGSIVLVPPLNYVIDLSEHLKGTWVTSKDQEPPFGHAEQLSLQVFTSKMGIPFNSAVAELKAVGIAIGSPSERIEDIARANRTTPMDIYMMIKKFEPSTDMTAIIYTAEIVDDKFAGTGLGRKALPWILDDLKLDPAVARARLRAQGIEVRDTETLKQASTRYGIEPIDILKTILVEGYNPFNKTADSW